MTTTDPSEPRSSTQNNSEDDDLDEFDRRLLRQIEERIDRLEAVRNYSAVKKERDEAFEMLSNAAELVSIQDSTIETLTGDNNGLQDLIRELLEVPPNISNNSNSHNQEQELWRHDAVIGRLIRTAMEYPADSAKGIPFELAVPLLNVVAAMCKANDIGTEANILNESFDEIESAVDLIETAKSAIESDLEPQESIP